MRKGVDQASRSLQRFKRDTDHAVRGLASGTGVMHSFGRSLAFASGGFVAFEGFSKIITESISAAREAAVAQRSLAAQMKASGESFRGNRERVEQLANSYAKFGFDNDEVIQSLTVLERGTGRINQAMKLQQLTADIARAKNLGLAAAAQTVAKVFGGQETALRRAVPGLEKNAHGWDLIRLAQAKMAGQAAAGTTASERFAAALHNTEEVIGTALLPTLNKFLNSMSRWLSKSENQRRIQKDVTEAVNILTDALKFLKAVFDRLSIVTGSTKNTLKALFAVFVGFKVMAYASALKTIATNIGLIGTTAARATPQVEGFAAAGAGAGGGGKGGGGIGGVLAGLGLGALAKSGGELAARFGALGMGGMRQLPETAASLIKAAGTPFKGAPGVYRLGNRFYKVTGGGGAQEISVDDLLKLIRKGARAARPATPIVTDVTSGGYGGGIPTNVPAVKRTAEQLNNWFDAMINRQLGRVQDIQSLKGQNQRLEQIKREIQERIKKTNDITRRLKLQDEVDDINRQLADNQKQGWADFMDSLSLKAEMAGATKSLNDDIAAQQQIIAALDKQIQQYGATTDLLRQRFEAQQAIVQFQQQQAQAQRDAARAARVAAAQAKAGALQRKLDWAEFALERAQDTKTLKDDIKALRLIIALIKQQIRETGLTIDRARQLYAAQKQLRDLLNQKKPKKRGGGGWVIGPLPSDLRTNPVGGARLTAPAPAPIPATGFGSGMAVNQMTVNMYGVQNVPQLETELHKRAKARSQPRRGP